MVIVTSWRRFDSYGHKRRLVKHWPGPIGLLNSRDAGVWRFPRQKNGGRVEFALRHMSNAGLKKPNKGQDFLTLAYVF